MNAVKETLKEVLKLKGQQLLSPQFHMRLPPHAHIHTHTAPGTANATGALVVLRAHAFHNPYSEELEFVIGKLRVLETPLPHATAPASTAAAASCSTAAASSSSIGAAMQQTYAHVPQPKHDFPSLVDLSYAAGASGLEPQEEPAGPAGASAQDFYPEWPPAHTQASAARMSADQHAHFASTLYNSPAVAAAPDYLSTHASQAVGLPAYQSPFLPSPTHLDPPTLANPYRLAPSQFLNAAGTRRTLFNSDART